MKIQKIIFPSKEICNEWKMYFQSDVPQNCDATVDYRNNDDDVIKLMEENGHKTENDEITFDEESNLIKVKSGCAISLESYFNAFSIGKWSQYTGIDSLEIELEIAGDAEIHIYHAVGQTNEAAQNSLGNMEMYSGLSVHRDCIDDECEVSFDNGMCQVLISKMYDTGIIYPVITAKSDIVISGGAYKTNSSPRNDINIALGICTFKREDFVTNNVAKVIRDTIANTESPLYGHLEAYVSDNGQTLSMDDFLEAYRCLNGSDNIEDVENKIHLFPNMNAGGAGGFTRTIIESLIKREDAPFSHIILMDDDIILDCRVLERTYNLLRFLKSEYKNSMVGGTMFELDYRFLQFEGGAKFGGIEVEFFNKKWDMRFADAVACNEVINPMNYSGWWYSVIPSSIINENNLPIPLFIHYDDIEYGIRNEENGTILINGICVWHPQGANKAPISMNYYDVRNMLIANVGRHDELTAEQLIFHMKNRIVGDVIRYRYEAAERVFEAIDDFYKGPQYFMNLDPIENHKRLMSGNYKIQTPEETGIDLSQCVEVEDIDVPRWWYVWDAFCWLLPKFKKVRVAGVKDHGLPYLAGSIYFYDESKKGGFLVKRDYGRAWKMCKRFFSTRRMIRNNHERVMKEWADAKKEFVSLAYWEKYLQI